MERKGNLPPSQRYNSPNSEKKVRKKNSAIEDSRQFIQANLIEYGHKSLAMKETQTLGYVWDPKNDKVQLDVKINEENMLTMSSKYFDPQGGYSPALFIAKILLQRDFGVYGQHQGCHSELSHSMPQEY
ncbi:unnamed protein product [Lepeophtheirus salmonis]|uniref:(salmon louse) hypothetical protein n=1 Tax=Lepeophtheirus salmonis TaxID=72036 RepID=A0A7R8D2Z4_LEPSM|nr:unnamed protein product [Lepeophtheirus salmonis]CAF2960577.1 unnamed protein product [Lepeophtheirus salmonis]